MKARNAPFWAPLFLLVLASAFIRFANWDEACARLFWSERSGWIWRESSWVKFLYQYGTFPALAATIIAGLICVGYFFRLQPRARAKLSAFVIALMIVGPGLLVNAILKDHFGRSRPVQVTAFGGGKAFQPLGKPDFSLPGKSFPCGHASMGFFWLGLYVYFRKRRAIFAWSFAALGLVHGAAMGFGRMAQGSHWLSDALWSGGIVYFSAWFLHYFWFFSPDLVPAQTPSALNGPAPAVFPNSYLPHDGDLSVVVPFFNEAENVQFVLQELRAILPNSEVIAVDDGSLDDTWQKICKVPGIRTLRLGRNLGQSAAIYYGLRLCTRSICGLMDGDGQNDPRNFLTLMKSYSSSGADVVCGYRKVRKDTWSRRAASRIANTIRQRILEDGVRDTGCTQKVFRREAVELLVPFRGMHRYLPAIFTHGGLQIAEVAVEHRPRRAGDSKYDNWSRAISGAYDIIGVRWLLKRKLPRIDSQTEQAYERSDIPDPHLR